jgi:hypothetical protein
MVSPGVITGFAAIDATVIAEALYAIRDYRRNHPDESANVRARTPHRN